jgi:L-threonylcarbamoyladenylate synthase
MITGHLEPGKMGRLAEILKSGGVAVLPTDTIYGFHCISTSGPAVERIMQLKGKTGRSPFILLVSNMDMADSLVADWPGESRKLLERSWPAPLTAVLPAGSRVSPGLAPDGRVALRIPALSPLRRLIERAGAPLISTSVNISGKKPISRIRDIMKDFPGLDAYISRMGRPGSLPTTVVDFSAIPFRILRQGGHVLKIHSRSGASGRRKS